MASQSLYRKWRSQTFGDLVGQEPVVRTLQNALKSGNLAHAYLFTGPRGTGKTSTARLLAKTINCTNPVNGEPCNQCQQCREITAGNSFNVIEIDAASNRGIDSIRDLREKVMMPPSTGKYKVYVLDEAHMLTTEAFNALLKTLEEPPPYAIFVMATTDVHKMLPTVLSRCQRFDFKRITTRQIVEHLEFVAEQEQIKIERSAAELIARAAAGGMRDALSLLDQAIAYCGEEITLVQVQTMLGVADPRAIHKLITAVAQLDSAVGLHLIHELAEAGADLRQINIQLGEYWRALMLAKAGADIATILDRTEDEAREIMQTIGLFGLEELTEFARIFAQNDLMQKNQGTPQLGLELALLQSIELHRRLQSGQSLAVASTISTPSIQPRPASAQVQPRQVVSAPPHTQETHQSLPTALPTRQPSPANTIGESSTSLPDPDGFLPLDEIETEFEQSPSSMSMPPSTDASVVHNAESANDAQPSLTLQQIHNAWERVKKRVKGRNAAGPKTSAYLNDYAVVAIEIVGKETVVIIQAAHPPHYKYLYEHAEYCADVDWALSLEFNQPCRIRLLAPNQPIPVAPVHTVPTNSSSYSANTTMPVMPQQSAYSERPASSPSSAKGHTQVERGNQSEATAVVTQLPDKGQNSSVVKKNMVRENTSKGSSASLQVERSSPEVTKQKVSSDPVVQEVVRMFDAKIVDIRLKQGNI